MRESTVVEGIPIAEDALAPLIVERARGRERFLVALAGAPGAGKSTLAARLVGRLTRDDENAAIVVPMDGFHFDNAVLEERGLLSRKGAPETFDVQGFIVLLERLSAAGGSEVAIPLFDRDLEISRAAAAIVGRDHRIIIVEGNYLLIDEPPWRELKDLFDLTLFVSVPTAELEQRLIQRWLDYGHDLDAARAMVRSNDIPNAHYVQAHSRLADYVIR